MAATRNLRFFAENIAPIPEAIKYLGIYFDLKWRIITNAEEMAVGDEVAAVKPENQGRQELVSRLARALVEVEGETVTFAQDPQEDVRRRLHWAMYEWDEVFLAEMAASYDRARHQIVHAVQEITEDPNLEAGRSESSGVSIAPSGDLRENFSPPESGPMSSTTSTRMRKRKQNTDLPSAAS